MTRPLYIGAIAGILITLSLTLYLRNQNVLDRDWNPNWSTAGRHVRESKTAPLVTVLNQFHTNFAGSEDLMAHRAGILQPNTTIAAWDKAMSESGLGADLKTTSGCRYAELSQSISIRPEHVRQILSGETNVIFIANDSPKCFAASSKLVLVIDDLISGEVAYDIPGFVQIERIAEVPLLEIQDQTLSALKISRTDLPNLVFGNNGRVNLALSTTILHFRLLKDEKPTLDPRRIPAFMAGVDGIRPSTLTRFLSGLRTSAAPVLIDTRDPRSQSVATMPQAISVPFISANERQLEFLLDMPIALVAGGRIDTSKIQNLLLTQAPLFLFGENGQDASVYWVARNLRIIGFRRVFFIIGGIEALKRDAPDLKF